MHTLPDEALNLDELTPIGEAVRRIQGHFPSVTASSLRFLERLGLITTTRTAGGHRLFTPSDIRRILQIKAWQQEGLTLAQIGERLTELDQLPNVDVLGNEFVQLILARQFIRARELAMNADVLGVSLESIFGEVLQPALYAIGARWQEGRMFVAQEKEASELVRDIIAELSHRHDQSMSGNQVLVAGCVRGELHDLGLRMICGLLRSRGFIVQSLGPDVHAEFFAEAVELYRPDAVLLSVRFEQNVARVRDILRSIEEVVAPEPPPSVLIGGEAAQFASQELSDLNVIVVQASSLTGAVDSVIQHMKPGTSPTEPEPYG